MTTTIARDENNASSPLTLLGSAAYNELVAALETSKLKFPRDVAVRTASFLVVQPVVGTEISAVACSSTRGDFPLSITLAEEEESSSWWISAEGTMVNGIGEQWLEYKLTPSAGTILRRCRFVGVSIPPLPQGPLSVRQFRVDSSQDGGKTWMLGGTIYETENETGIQTFRLAQEIDANRVRLVCLTNAAARNDEIYSAWYDCVGLYRVRWT